MNIEDLETKAKTVAADVKNESRVIEAEAESFVGFLKAHKLQAIAIAAVLVLLIVAGVASRH